MRAVVSTAARASLFASEGLTAFSVTLNISSISGSIRPKWPQVFLSSFGTSVLSEFFVQVVLVFIGLIYLKVVVSRSCAASRWCGHPSAKMAISADFGFPRIQSLRFSREFHKELNRPSSRPPSAGPGWSSSSQELITSTSDTTTGTDCLSAAAEVDGRVTGTDCSIGSFLIFTGFCGLRLSTVDPGGIASSWLAA